MIRITCINSYQCDQTDSTWVGNTRRSETYQPILVSRIVSNIHLVEYSKDSKYSSNESKLEPIPFNTTTNDFDIGIELSFRPSVTFIASIGALSADAAVQLAVTLDVPKLDVEVSQVHNVDSSCNPAPASLPPDQVYQNLTLLVPSIGFDAFEVFTETGKIPGLDLSADQSFEQTSSKNITTACYFFDAAKKTLGPAPTIKSSSATSNHIALTGIFMAIMIAVLMGM